MKKWYILSILFLSFSFAQAQHVAYDLNSNWFWGLNAGVTWNTNDVKNVNSSGYGLTLGRSFNYDYGKRISFDLRARYLTGNWVGQDVDTFSLNQYAGGPLSIYQLDSSSVYVNNFQTEVKRLSLELVLHLNNVKERTGFDPYVFGGIGLTWTQTYGDLLNGLDSSSLYDYSSLIQNGPISPQLPSTLDGLYETRLDGGSNNSYNVKWMPSLGFGLGYQIGKRVSIGIEHKTTFTKGDSFDGFISATPRTKNDWYHYTSGYLQIHFKSRGNRPLAENNTNNVNNYTTATNCPKPVITVLTGNNKTVTNSQYRIECKVDNLLSSAGATLLNDLNQPVLFNYNASTQIIDAVVQLHTGQNTFYLSANNNCGNEAVTITVTLLNCTTPTAQFTSPNGGSTTVKSSDFAFSAIIQGTVNASNIKLLMNGMALNGATYNPNNGLLQRAITLIPGVNTIQLTVSNDCGSNTYNATINYDNCVTPSLQLISPSASGTTTNLSAYTLSANMNGTLTNSKVKVFQNGILLNNVSIQANGQIQIPVTLVAGLNTFNLEVSNNCGSDSEIITINFQNCNAPIVTIQSPTQNQSITSTSNPIRLKALVSNVGSKQNIKLIFNGIEQANFTYNAATGLVELGLNPINGSNSLTITATNNCGSDVETVQFNNINCTGQTPVVSILSTSGTTNTAIYNLFASTSSVGSTLLNAPTVSVTQNGSPIAFNQAAGQINAVTTLLPGINTFVVTATSVSCGSDSKTITVNYNNCIAPQITLIQPTSTGGTTNTSSLSFKANASNIAQTQNIQLVKNGQQIPFTFNNGMIEASINLSSGINTITLSVSNACGNDAETITVNYVQCTPPTIQLNSTIATGTTVTNANFAFNAIVLGASGQKMSLKLNGVSSVFNNGNDAVTANLTLAPGLNTIVFSASNDCGADVETILVNYDNCLVPVISNFSNNASSIIAFANASQVISANISNANVQNIVFTQNGIQRPFTFTNGQFSAGINLISGSNSFVLSVTNNCGTDQHNWNMQYTPCTAPIVSILNPSNSGVTVSAASVNFQASLSNITGPQEILLSLNGNSIATYTYANGSLNANLNLQNGLNTIVLKGTNSCGVDIKTITVFYNNCVAPIISVSSPSSTNPTVSTAAFTYTASVQNLANSQGILLSLNGTAISNYTYSNGTVTAQVNLTAGTNTFVLSVTNGCGSDMKSTNVNYLNCTSPSVAITNPSNNNTSVTSAVFNVQATVQHMSSAQGISLSLNGVALTNFNYANGQLSASVNLTPGLNTFVISVINACGTDTKTQVINFTACTAPQVQIVSPNNTNFGVSNPMVNFQATISQLNSSQGINLTLNGNPISNYSFANGQLSANITLNNGVNTIALSATNNCGNDAQNCIIRYEPCNPPVITITSPTGTTFTANSNTLAFSGTVQNMTSAQGLSLTVNGVPVSGVQFNENSGQVTATIPLSNGNNSIVLSANGSCGTDTKTISVSYNPCVAPIVSMTNPSSSIVTVSTNNYAFSGTVQNATAQQTSLTVNGVNISNFNFTNGTVTANLSLANGNNEIVLKAINACGTDSKTSTIKYEECLAPQVTITNPSSASSSVTNANFNFTGNIENIGNGQGISLTLNGNIIPNASFSNGQISAILTLNNGVNQIVLSAINNCGNDSQTITVMFNPCVAPIVTIINPVDLFYGVNSPIFPFQASIQNMPSAQGINLSVSGNPVNNFTFNNGNLTATLNLPEGVNEIVLTATNACGTSSQLRTIRYQSCLVPEIIVTTDLGSGSTVTFNNVVYTATVINYAPTTVLQLLVNGVEQTTFVNSNGNISASINLVSGNNDVQLTATSECGSDTELYNLDFQEGTPNNGTSGGMIQQNQSPTEIKNNSPQNQPAQPKPTPVQPKPVQPTPTKPTTTPTKPTNPAPSKPTNPAPTKPTANPTPTPNKPTTNPAQTPVKPTQPTNPEPVKPTSGGGTNTTTPQQSPQNPSKTETPKGGTTEKGGGK